MQTCINRVFYTMVYLYHSFKQKRRPSGAALLSEPNLWSFFDEASRFPITIFLNNC